MEERWIDGQLYVTEWTYDAMDRVVTMKYPDNEVVSYTYNAQLLLASMSGFITATGYNAAGQPTSITYGNGDVTEMAYDPQMFRLQSYYVRGVVDLSYGYDNKGNVSRITEGGVPTNFTYDHLDRLTGASGEYSASYSYNQIANILSKVEGSTSHTYQYSDPNHKHAPSLIDTVEQAYDANGNLDSRWQLGEVYKYDAENRLVKLARSGVYIARFAYDGDGKRVKRVDNYGSIHYVGPHYERNVGNGQDTTEVITKLYWAQLGPYRRLLAVRKGGVLSYIHHDHLGSTKAVSGGAFKYYPYGYAYQEVQNPPTDNLYTGQKRDLSTGLYHYGARYYDAGLGRFVQPDTVVPDPKNPQALNRYSYGYNNPVKYSDPSGQRPIYDPEEPREPPPPPPPPHVSEPPLPAIGPEVWYGYGDPQYTGPSLPIAMPEPEPPVPVPLVPEPVPRPTPVPTPTRPALKRPIAQGEPVALPAPVPLPLAAEIAAQACLVREPRPKLSDVVRASGQAAQALNTVLSVPHLGEEATYAIGGAMLFARVGVRFVPYVGWGVLTVEFVSWGWATAAPWVGTQLKYWGM